MAPFESFVEHLLAPIILVEEHQICRNKPIIFIYKIQEITNVFIKDDNAIYNTGKKVGRIMFCIQEAVVQKRAMICIIDSGA